LLIFAHDVEKEQNKLLEKRASSVISRFTQKTHSVVSAHSPSAVLHEDRGGEGREVKWRGVADGQADWRVGEELLTLPRLELN
jgi:hypothetical protein